MSHAAFSIQQLSLVIVTENLSGSDREKEKEEEEEEKKEDEEGGGRREDVWCENGEKMSKAKMSKTKKLTRTEGK